MPNLTKLIKLIQLHYPKLSENEIMLMIQDKRKQLGEMLINDESAALIIVRELGFDLSTPEIGFRPRPTEQETPVHQLGLIDHEKIFHLIVMRKWPQQEVSLSLKYKTFDGNPEGLANYFVPGEDGFRPLSTKASMITVGGKLGPKSTKYAVVLFVDTSVEYSDTEWLNSYFKRLECILDFVENGIIDLRRHHISREILSRFISDAPNLMKIGFLQNLLTVYDMEWVGLLDINLENLIESILDVAYYLDEKDLVRELVFNAVSNQIDHGGTTIGLDVFRMKDYGVLAKHVTHVLELRKNEMANLVIDDSSDPVDLTPLWLTAYGYQVLSELNLGRDCTSEEFKEISSEFKKHGFDIQYGLVPKTIVSKITTDMKKYILKSSIEISQFSKSQKNAIIDIIEQILE